MKFRAGFLMVFTGLAVASCDGFSSGEKQTRQLVEAELSSIDWNEVDQFPLFEDCAETTSKPEQRRCFENTLVMHLSMALQDMEFRADQPIADTLYVDFLVDNQGGITVMNIEENPAFNQENPEFKRVVSGSLRSLPRLQPAIKRGIPVASRFRIPLVIQTHE